MAEFSVIKEADAPKRAQASGRLKSRMAEYEGYVTSVRRGQVGRIAPGPAESARGIALRVSRAARRAGRTAETWTSDGVVYFSVS